MHLALLCRPRVVPPASQLAPCHYHRHHPLLQHTQHIAGQARPAVRSSTDLDKRQTSRQAGLYSQKVHIHTHRLRKRRNRSVHCKQHKAATNELDMNSFL